jgi:ribosomal protein S18 acetylase RimI-like enzyme
MEKYRGKKNIEGIKYSNLILKKIINIAKNRNIDKIWLWTTSDNIPAINLYIKFNFVIKNIPIKLKNKIYKKYKWLIDKELVYMENF